VFKSTDGRLFDDVLAEFDSVFPAANVATKNPTTSRRIGKREDEILLPGDLDVSQVLTALRFSLGERYLLIVSNLYIRGLFRRKTDNPPKIHRNTLRMLGGERYLKLLNYGMTQKHIIKGREKYKVGVRSNAYMLNKDTFSLRTQQRYRLTTVAAIEARPKLKNVSRNEYRKMGPVYEKISKSYEGLSFDYSGAIAHVSKLPNTTAKETAAKIHRQRFVDALIHGWESWTVDRQGRNYTLLVNCPRDLRPFFIHQQGPLYAVDIKSSQPLLHILLYEVLPDAKKPCDEEKKYRSIVEGGTFWDFINKTAGSPYDLSNDNQKSELKEALFQQVFYRTKETGKGVTKPFAVLFKMTFPILWGLMNGVKTTARHGSSEIAREMQRNEADAVRDAMTPHLGKPYPLITIHDCIVTTKEGLADVRASLLASFSTGNLKPVLSEKRLQL
jgi:hypothetical protein